VLKGRNILKNVGITSAGAGAGGLLGHYLHGALADEDNPSTLGYLASTLGGAGLGGAASYFGGTEQGRKTMSDAAAKLISLMQKKSAAAKMCDCCKKTPCQCPPNCSCGCKSKMAAAKPGLWANIHAKKERGAAPAKPGDKNYPDAKNWKKVTEQSEKKAGLFYKNLDRPVFVGLEDEKGALGLAAMRTQEPRALTRLFDNSDLDVDKAIKHMNDNNWANDNKHSTFHPADQLNLALKKLFPSRYRTPNLNDAATFIASDLNQQPEPKTKNEFNKLIQSKYKHLLHTPYLSTEDSTDLKNFINALGESFPEKQNKTVKKASPAWQTSEGKSESGGLNDKGRASLKAQGHDIKRPQPEGGPRKDSFCARMKGLKEKLTSSETASDPDSRVNKALRKWKCGSAQEKWAALATLALSTKAPSLGSVISEPKNQKFNGIKFQFCTATPSFLR